MKIYSLLTMKNEKRRNPSRFSFTFAVEQFNLKTKQSFILKHTMFMKMTNWFFLAFWHQKECEKVAQRRCALCHCRRIAEAFVAETLVQMPMVRHHYRLGGACLFYLFWRFTDRRQGLSALVPHSHGSVLWLVAGKDSCQSLCNCAQSTSKKGREAI